MERKTLLQAFILGFGQITGKILSLIFLFRFSKDLGNTGLVLYTYAYIPFSIFSDLSQFGLIPGTSKAVAKLISNNQKRNAYYLLKKGTILCIVIGIFFFLFMLFFSRQILSISLFENIDKENFEEIRINLLLASLALFIVPLIQFLKGFLQGLMKMYPSCISIILEYFTRLILYISLVNSLNTPNDIIHSVFLIYFAGHLVSLVFLICFSFKYYRKKGVKFNSVKYLLKISIPYGIATMFFTIYQLVDSITLSVLMPIEGYYTAYMFETIRLIFLPIILAQSLGGALNPRINYLYQENQKKEASKVAGKSTCAIIYILIPLIIIMKYFSKDIYSLFYNQENGDIVLFHIADLILFFGLYKVLIGISFGLSRSNFMIIATILSGVAKYILNYLFIPKLGYLGAIYATMVSISICIIVSYYILYKEGINIFIKNMKALLIGIIIGIISIFLVIIFRLIFYLKSYPSYVNVILYSILLLGIYYLICSFLKTFIYNKKQIIA